MFNNENKKLINKYLSEEISFNEFVNAIKTNEKLLSFIESEKFLSKLSESISCVITTKEMADKIPGNIGVIISNRPRIDFFKLHNSLVENKKLIC